MIFFFLDGTAFSGGMAFDTLRKPVGTSCSWSSMFAARSVRLSTSAPFTFTCANRLAACDSMSLKRLPRSSAAVASCSRVVWRD
jgi:hypothetical protein